MKPSKKKIAISILIIVLIAAIALGFYRVTDSQKPKEVTEKKPINVSVGVAEMNSIYTTSPLMGRIDPVETATVVPMTTGEITAVYVSIGDYVKKGAVLFEIDKTQMVTTYNQAKITCESAKNDSERMLFLYNEGAISLQEYEAVKTQYELAKESLASASNALNYCSVTSPINGYITSINVAAGGLATQSMTAITIANVSTLEINATVSEYLIQKIKIGEKVNIHIKTLSNEPFTGTVKAISPAPAVGSLTYPVTISVDNPKGNIKAGMFAEVQIITERKDNVLCVPSDAVFMKAGEAKVAVLDGNIPSLVTVTTGLDNGTLVEITSGLKSGEVIVTTGQQYVVEGEKVNIIADK